MNSDPELIYLTDGASKGVMQILQTIIRGPSDGVIIFKGSVDKKFAFISNDSSSCWSPPSPSPQLPSGWLPMGLFSLVFAAVIL